MPTFLREIRPQCFLYYVSDALPFLQCPNPRLAVRLGIKVERSLLQLGTFGFHYHYADYTTSRKPLANAIPDCLSLSAMIARSFLFE